MPIDMEIRHGNRGLVLICHGTYDVKERIQIRNQLLSSPDLLKSIRYVLIDEMRVKSIDIATPDLQYIAEQDKRLQDLFVPNLPVAIVAAHDLQYGLARMWEALVSKTGWDVTVVRTLPEAAVWIRRKLKERFDIDLPLDSDAV
jgi:hypothetical protein